MVEEKARSLLPRHHFSNLSYYIAEYGARAMNIEAFVSVLLEMLDTPEKVRNKYNMNVVIKERSEHLAKHYNPTFHCVLLAGALLEFSRYVPFYLS